MKKLVVCIPTYQRPDFIDELLREGNEIFYSLGIDIYIMDSSKDSQTKQIVSIYQERYGNVFYYHFPPEMHSNVKVYKIFQMAKSEIECDYLWMMSDSIRCSSLIVNAVFKYLEKECDIYVIHTRIRFVNDFVYVLKDYQQFFQLYTWTVTLYGATILNVKRMIIPADWKYLSDKYLAGEGINFSHVAFYLEQIIKIDDFRAMIINAPGNMFYQSRKKLHSKAFWYKDSIKMFIHNWPCLIESLPDTYYNKIEVIKSATYNRYLPSSLKEFVATGVLTPQIYESFKEDIKKYTDISPKYFWEAANKKEISILDKNIFEKIDECKRLIEFASKYSKLYIYGCGIRGKRYAEYLLAYNLDFDSFIISDSNEAILKGEMYGHSVIGLDEQSFDNATGVLLGMEPINQLEVYPKLINKVPLEHIFAYPDRYDYIAKVISQLEKM